MRISPIMWCLIVLVHTPNQTVLVSSWNLMNLISSTPSKSQTGPSIFNHMDAAQILQFIRQALNAACTSSVPCSTITTSAPPRLDSTLNLTVTQVRNLFLFYVCFTFSRLACFREKMWHMYHLRRSGYFALQ